MWLRRLAAAGLVVVLLLGLAVVYVADSIPRDDVEAAAPGSLTVSERALGTWRVATIDVTVTETGLRVTDSAREDLVVWESPEGQAFVTAVIGDLSWRHSRGYAWPTTKHECELVDQEVRSVTSDGGRLELSGVLSGCDKRREYTVSVRLGPTDGDAVLEVRSRSVDALGLVTGRSPQAGVHGFGEQFAPFDLSDRVTPLVVREQGVGRGAQPLTLMADLLSNGAGGTDTMTYAAIPSFVTDDLRGVELDPTFGGSHAFAVADTRGESTVVLTSWRTHLRAILTADTTPAALITRRAAGITPPSLPRWLSRGAVVAIGGGTEQVRRTVADLQDAGTAIAAVWVPDWTGTRPDDPWDRLWWTWQLDTGNYAGWDQMVADLADQGIRVLTYVSPRLVDAEDKGDPTIRNLYAEAEAAGYLVLNQDGEVYLMDQGGFESAMVDLTNPEAQGWYAEVIATEVLGRGVSGFMADYSDGLPFDAVLHGGDPAIERNRWPAWWARTVRDACERAEQRRCVTWFRAAGGGTNQHAPLFWSGDQLVDFSVEDGMASALLGTLSAGVSGWRLTHSDIGGSTSIEVPLADYVRSAELNQRWAEMEAFGVVMRTHESNRPDDNEQVYRTPESRQAFARMTRLFAALAPYRREVVAVATESGLPAIRHSWLRYPNSLAADYDTQFFFGPSILVAPVLTEGATTVEVAFPRGDWVHLITGETFRGDQVLEVEAPLGTPAAFVRSDDPLRADLEARVAQADL